ncbi:TonB-dependent receptor [Helicobacter sp. 16-1353]|uniref:TonB-dependent receptor n=1 Tax=Helicobacter sp. 16-1353 TaxID=2004996 RepID=UPI0015EFAC17|nr:TonB-dependent receptor [Helicobacter sp. 16-1353]
MKDIAQSLQYTSGVIYSPPASHRGEPSFSIRGYAGRETGIFIDGIPMYSIYDKRTDWGQFTLFDTESISISKGYTSMLYGPNTIGGAVNLVTKKPKDKLEVELRGQYQTPNQHYEYARIGTNLGKFYAQFSFSNMQRKYYQLSKHFKPTAWQRDRNRVGSYYKNMRFNLKLGFTPNLTDEYSLNLTYQNGDRGGVINTKQNSNILHWPKYEKITAYFLSNTKLGDMVTLTSRIFYDTFDNELDGKGQLLANGTINPTGGIFAGYSRYDDWTLGATLGLGIDISPDDYLKFSILAKSDNHLEKANQISSPPAQYPMSKQSDITSYIAGEYTRIFLDNLRASFSLNYTRNDVINAETLVNNNSPITKDPLRSLGGVGAQAILYYDPIDSVNLYATIGKKDALPTLMDRYGAVGGSRLPNPDLKTETAINYELGLSYYPIDELRLSLAGFFNDLTDMIVTENVADSLCAAGANCRRLTNKPNGNAWGIEAEIQYELISTLSINANYAYIKKKSQDGTIITDYPNHIASARIKYNPLIDLDLIAGGRYTSPRIVRVNNNYIDSPNVFLLDIRAAYRISGFEIALGIDNVTDRNYWYSYGYEMEGRRYYVELGYKY